MKTEQAMERNWKWAIDNNIQIINAEDLFDEMLNDCSPMISLAGCEYLPSDVLKRVDPVVYRCGVSDYIDSLISDIDSGIVQLDDGTLVDAYQFESAVEKTIY